MLFDPSGKKVWVAGHKGMVGSAIVRRLQQENCEILTVDKSELNLLNQAGIEKWMMEQRPDIVFMAAARVGGIHANNTQPANFLYENLAIQTNIIHASYLAGVKKLVFLGSSCIYPKFAEQPIKEESLLTGPLEPTNEWYAIAKIAGLKMCQAYRRQYGCDYICAMPTNLYGAGDNYDLDNSHVAAALLIKTQLAKFNGDKQLVIWGSGKPLREFMYVDDLADALVFLTKNYSASEHINVGTGQEVSIKSLAEIICDIVGFEGEFIFDASRPDGTPRKLMDSSRLGQLGWKPRYSLGDGLKLTYKSFNEAFLTNSSR
jgi:GDP-L-fucose synthase